MYRHIPGGKDITHVQIIESPSGRELQVVAVQSNGRPQLLRTFGPYEHKLIRNYATEKAKELNVPLKGQ